MTSSELLLLWTGFILVNSRQAVGEAGQDIVNLSNQTLERIPSNLPSNITNLTLSFNLVRISKADLETLKIYPALTNLHLNNNKITALPAHSFNHLSVLKILDLSHNNISRAEPGTFSGLGSLKELDLSHNAIHSLPPEVFAGLSSLESLNLQGNGLQSLEEGLLRDLTKLRRIHLDGNPWNCTCDFLRLIKQQTNSGLQINQAAACSSPEEKSGKSILDAGTDCFSRTTSEPTSNTKPDAAQTTHAALTGHSTDPSGAAPPVGNTWKFLVGVVTMALSTSMLIVCAVKSPSWYKMLFNYRHQRLCEEEPSIFTTGRYSNFSLDTEQTEASAQEMEASLDDEDGFIEDRYIETGDFKDNPEV